MTSATRYLLVLDSSTVAYDDDGPYVADVYHEGGDVSARYLPAADCTPPTEHTEDAPVQPAWKVELPGASSEVAFVSESDVAAVIDLYELPQDTLLTAIQDHAPSALSSDGVLN